MPNDNKQQTTTAPPIIFTEDALPPMPQENSGSAAPADDIVMPVITTSTTPKKKFAGGKVIATILGLFLLVGGIGAGVFLVGQNQNIAEQAEKTTSYADKCKDVVCKANEECRGDGNCVWVKPAPEENIPGYVCTASNCPGPEFYCQNSNTCLDAEGYRDGKAIPMPTNAPVNPCRGGDVFFGNKCVPPGNCQDNQGNCYVKTNIGVGERDKQVCDGPHWTTCAEGYVCSNEDCVPSSPNKTPKPPSDIEAPPTTFTPTAPPSITATAQCQNIKAYSPTWALLTNAQLSVLTTGSQVNFCVAGVASAETFDKARLTINGVLQAETTTKRPGNDDFCQLYTVPAGVTIFNVTAQIHHVTLGWK